MKRMMVSIVAAAVLLGGLAAPAQAASRSLGATTPWTVGKTVYYKATSTCSTTLKAQLSYGSNC